MNNKLKSRQGGSALLVALIFLGVLTMVGVSVTLTSTSQLKIAANGEEINDTFHATNAGINLFLSQTVIGGKDAGDDSFLDSNSQSGAEEDTEI